MTHDASQIIRQEHAAVAAVLRSLLLLLGQGPGDEPARFFDVARAMLFYIDEFPERLHHPKESELLFPMLARADAALAKVIERLDGDHREGQGQVRELQHLLLAWELLGESRREAFTQAAARYVDFYLEHMRIEEAEVLPAAERALTVDDWAVLNKAFRTSRDPLAEGSRDSRYDRLFTRIVMTAPAPIGVGREFAHHGAPRDAAGPQAA